MTKVLSIKAIQGLLQEVSSLQDPLLTKLSQDQRSGVQAALIKRIRQLEKLEKRQQVFEAMQTYEKDMWKQGYKLVAGIDEVGRGPLAGPVVAAAVILPHDMPDIGLNDSKKLSAKQRSLIKDQLVQMALAIGIGQVEAPDIDQMNIYQASKLAMVKALDNLAIQPQACLIDAMTLEIDLPQEGIIKGDAKSLSIAAASIIAKDYRDKLMEDYDQIYPGYQFGQHAGYPTQVHLQALEVLGPSPIHRKSYGPVKEIIEKQK